MSAAQSLLSSDLVEGWADVPLDHIAHQIQYGYTASATKGEAGPRFLRITDIQEGMVDWETVPTCDIDREDLEKYTLRPGDMVFARTGATTGKSYLIRSCPPDAVFASYLIRLRLCAGIDPAFVNLFFNTPRYWEYISENVAGNAQPNCNATKLGELLIPVPPMAEQKRIVKKAEQLLASVNSARERLTRVPLILKRFRQAVLAAACSGRLTADWREQSTSEMDASILLATETRHRQFPEVLKHDLKSQQASEPLTAIPDLPEIPNVWQWIYFGELLASLRSGSTAVPQNQTTPYPILRSSSVRQLSADLTDVRFLTAEQSGNELNFLKEGDLLFTRLSGSLDLVANCALVRNLNGERIQYPDRLFCAKLVEPQSGPYCELAFACPTLRDFLALESKSSAGHQRISMSALTQFPLPLPPLLEQKEIVRRAVSLFKQADTIEKRVAGATVQVEKLTQAILARAFRGELVPTEAELARREGRSYESAADLLARIRSESSEQKETPSLQKEKKWPTRSKRKTRGS